MVVNTARGAVMDEDALVKALESGQVWSAGLDVFEEEPKIHPGLVANPHVMLLPHLGTWTVEVSQQHLARMIRNTNVEADPDKNGRMEHLQRPLSAGERNT